jgi:hypothetical protein
VCVLLLLYHTHTHTHTFLCSEFLSEVIAHSEANKMTLNNIATVFGPCMLMPLSCDAQVNSYPCSTPGPCISPHSLSPGPYYPDSPFCIASLDPFPRLSVASLMCFSYMVFTHTHTHTHTYTYMHRC